MSQQAPEIRRRTDFIPFVGEFLYRSRNEHLPDTTSPYASRLRAWNVACCFVIPMFVALGICTYENRAGIKTFVNNCLEYVLKDTADSPPQTPRQ